MGYFSLVFLSLILILSSCARLADPAGVRQSHLQELSQELEQKSQQYLSQPLTLEQCISIAMANSYALRLSALERRMAELSRDHSFSAFLPQVTGSAQFTSWRNQQTMSGNPIQDKEYRTLSYGVAMPIFMPSTWLLYANSKLGVEQSVLTQHLARQSVVCNIMLLFYQTLMDEETLAVQQSQLAAAESQYQRMKQLYAEQQIRHWELVQAQSQYQGREAQVRICQRNLEISRGQLLQAMGLSPAHAQRLKLSDDSAKAPPALPNQSTQELILSALSSHPELSIADREIVKAENAVRQSIANFLPVVSAFLNGSWTSDSIADRANTLYGGIGASMDLFTGFAKYTGYQQSKVQHQRSQLSRNQLMLSIMMEVISAESQLRNAFDQYATVEMNYQALEARYQDYHQRFQEGLEPAYKMLDAQALRDESRGALVAARYQRNMAAAILQSALGALTPPAEVITPEDAANPPAIPAQEVLLPRP